MSYKDEAKTTQSAKRTAMGLSTAFPIKKTEGLSDAPLSNLEQRTEMPIINRKKGGRIAVEGAKAPKRLDRAGYANGGAVKPKKGATTVNVIVAGQGGQASPTPVPVPIPAGPPPGPPVGPPPGAGVPPGGLPPAMMGAGAGPAGPMPPPMMRKRGGRVDPSLKMTEAAGGGLGRLEKMKKYGDNAGKVPPGPAK